MKNMILFFMENESESKRSLILLLYNLILNDFFLSEKIVSIDFMKKYIHIAKAIKPQITPEAIKIISDEYEHLRSFDLNQHDVARVSTKTKKI